MDLTAEEVSSESTSEQYTGTSSSSEEGDRRDHKRTTSRKSEKRKKRPRFVEIEAEVGDDDEDEEHDDDEDELTRQFIADEGELAAHASDDDELEGTNVDRYRALARRQAAEEIDVDAEEQRLKNLYGKVHRIPRSDAAVPNQFLLPAVSDPKLWLVRCKTGQERSAVHQLLKVVLDSHSSPSPNTTPLQVYSATALDTLKGFIYVEAHKPAVVAEAIERAHIAHVLFAGGATGSKLVLVPLNEMTDVLKFSKAAKAATGDTTMPDLGDFVRIKRGRYAQDLAQVVEVPEEFDADSLGSVQVKVKVLPRLDYKLDAELTRHQREKSTEKPAARPFDQHEAARFGSVTKSRGYWIFAGETYKDGFLFKDFRLSSLITTSVNPLAKELERLGARDALDAADASSTTPHNAAPPKFFPQERVLIKQGDLKNLVGVIDSIQYDKNGREDAVAQVVLETSVISSKTVNVRTSHLEHVFKLGDAVRIVTGEHAGHTGMVVDIDKRSVSVYTDSGTQMSTPKASVQLEAVSASDAANASGVSSRSFKASSRFATFDLVQFGNDFGVVQQVLDSDDAVQIIDSTGNLRKESIDNVSKVQHERKMDADLKDGDRVFDSTGEKRLLLASHRGVAFLRKLEGGLDVSVCPVAQVTRQSVAEQTYRPPAPRFAAGGYSLIGKSVSISGGQYKGYVGIVKELTDAIARVELHTNSKLVTVDRERLVIAGQSGDAGRSSMTPGVAVGKTPAWAASGPGKTPAWGTSTGKTPAWGTSTGKTPAWSSATPVWNARTAASGKTPTWAAKTPVWRQTESLPGANAPSTTTTSSTSPAPSWAIPNAEVSIGTDKFRIASIDGSTLALLASNTAAPRTARASEAAPVLPAKKDRVAIHTHAPIAYGSVIGLDGPDAVVKIDGTGEFKIVSVNSLIKMFQ